MKPRWLALVLATVLLALSGCKLEDHFRERLHLSGDADEEQVEDKEEPEGDREAALACYLIEQSFAADLEPSTSTAESAYVDLNFIEWCLANLMRDDLENFVGNAAAWQADEDDPVITATSFSGRATRPYPAHGARLELNVVPPEGSLPFARKIHFADWEGENGTCSLEMRVYQQDIGETGKRPLLYLHGGGWRNRTTTMTAAEVLVSHLVKSHVVFMPSYPLNRDRDGPEACRNAPFEEILGSVQTAFDWVQQNMDVFGVNQGMAIDVMGHSAGGQMSAWLATQNPTSVGRFVNFYGPTEFAAFIDEAKTGGKYADEYEYSRRTIAYLFGADDINELERPYDALIMQNSLSEIVAEQGPGAVPPFLTVQGNEDTTVPVEQALISCNAIGGEASAEDGSYPCGNNGSRVVIIEGAGHNLDRRCASGVFPDETESDDDFENYCPTEPSRKKEVRAAVESAYEWLRAQ